VYCIVTLRRRLAAMSHKWKREAKSRWLEAVEQCSVAVLNPILKNV